MKELYDVPVMVEIIVSVEATSQEDAEDKVDTLSDADMFDMLVDQLPLLDKNLYSTMAH